MDLFSSRVFAKHAYVKKFPTVQLVCPDCGEVFAADFNQTRATCPACRKGFDPHAGPVAGAHADCGCGTRFAMAKTARARGEPPGHRLGETGHCASDTTRHPDGMVLLES